ncbi:MAG: ribonuclease HII [Thermoplasmata archaeon]
MIVCGVDEAGRGPVFGPLVLCGLCGNEDNLRNLGVKDSKLLSPSKREKLFDKIIGVAHSYKIEMIMPEQIDSLRTSLTLNEIEAIYFAKVIDSLDQYYFIVDAADVNEERFAETILKYVSRNIKIVSKHKADRDYPAVSAASIIAKVTRDREIEKIKKILGDFGSGYPSDPKTIKFLKDFYRKNGKLPPYVRRSWATLKNLYTLDNYSKGDKNEGTV